MRDLLFYGGKDLQIEREMPDADAHTNWLELINRLHLTADYRMWVSANLALQTVQCILSDSKKQQVSVGMGKGMNHMPVLGAEFESIEHLFYNSQTHSAKQRVLVSQIMEQDLDFLDDPALNQLSKNTKLTVDSFVDIESSKEVYYPSFLSDVNFIDDGVSINNHAYQYASDSGYASGSTVNEALLHSINELIERDSISRFIIKYGLGIKENSVTAFKIIPKSLPKDLYKIYLGLKDTVDTEVILVKVINNYQIPTYFTAVLSQGSDILPIYGSGSSVDERYAVMRSLTEAYQLVSVKKGSESQQLRKRLNLIWSEISPMKKMMSLTFTKTLASIRYHQHDIYVKEVDRMISYERERLRQEGRKIYYRVVKEDPGFVLVQSLIPHFERFNLVFEGQIVTPRLSRNGHQ
ncbi:YcaO-like family protein [Lactobacillus delbrueckii]|uniref:YcaO-like family protein n=2 Tax=Lactobacillus delbrueckii TaxID=1584 RepID=UPI0022EBE72F|nr:YcaO-like family protein [Lactobacillus delbrueckii]MDA3796523.1 YcaO-like family protein [Lactobacillus delbrueckii]